MMIGATRRDEVGSERRIAPRIPVQLSVRIEYADPRVFVRECCRNISIGGMFVESPNPPEVGRSVRFELVLPEPASTTLVGAGEVAWRRAPGDGQEARAGFGLRFVEIAPEVREMIFGLIDRFVQHGGTPFDLEAG